MALSHSFFTPVPPYFHLDVLKTRQYHKSKFLHGFPHSAPSPKKRKITLPFSPPLSSPSPPGFSLPHPPLPQVSLSQLRASLSSQPLKLRPLVLVPSLSSHRAKMSPEPHDALTPTLSPPILHLSRILESSRVSFLSNQPQYSDYTGKIMLFPFSNVKMETTSVY